MKYLLALALLILSLSSFAANLTVNVSGMSCGMCVKAITAELEKTGKVDGIKVSLEDKKAYFAEKKGQQITDEEVKAAIKKAGYSVTGINRK
ncbi:MAG TPA: heavy-metal-associated domain-containing protein [Bacteriovoracaceae bacterium]|nr:heavy-metal-associated domain-containing protein [Bacteriovoracaceae bacterium]